MERYQEYIDEKTAEDKKLLMQSFWRDIKKIARRYWDTFAVADFYNEMIAAYGDRWKCVRWTYNYEIVCVIVDAWSEDNLHDDIVFFAKYDETKAIGYKSAKYVTHNAQDYEREMH